jgi:hypothetical protein|nr:MAG TPA: hypothetical protein [Caudoviricetes sp.]
MTDTLLKMNRQTGEFRAYYSKSSTRWHTYVLNTGVIGAGVIMAACVLIGWYFTKTQFAPEAMLLLIIGLSLLIVFVGVVFMEGASYKKVPVEPKALLDSCVNPYFVMHLPIRGRRGITYFYIEDKDNAYLLDGLDCDFFKWSAWGEGKSYLVVDGHTRMIDYEFCSKTPSEIAEIIVDKHPLFMNDSIESVRKRNKLYKAMMTEICS